MKVLFDGDLEIARALAAVNLNSFQALLSTSEASLKLLPLSDAQKEILMAVREQGAPTHFLPGDTVRVKPISALSLQSYLDGIILNDPAMVAETLQKLQGAGVTPADLTSESLTAERLKALSVRLGPRKAILQQQSEAVKTFRVVKIRANGTYELAGEGSGMKEAHFALATLVEGGKLSSALSELGFVDKGQIWQALSSLSLDGFDAGLDTADGQRLIDALTSPAEASKPAPVNDAEVSSEDRKARAMVEDYAKLLAAMEAMRSQRPFPKAIAAAVVESLAAPKLGAANWTWGAYESADMSLSDEGMKVTKNYNSSPDYSCAVGSESFEDGTHAWEIKVDLTKSTSYSMWLGIARGVEERSGLGQYPTADFCDYVLAFHSGDNKDDRVLVGKKPRLEYVASTAFAAGQTVRFELDMNEHTLRMSVDGTLVVVARDVDDQGVRPFVCADYSESALIVSRECARPVEAAGVAVGAVSPEEMAAALDNSRWTEEMDAGLVKLPCAGAAIWGPVSAALSSVGCGPQGGAAALPCFICVFVRTSV